MAGIDWTQVALQVPGMAIVLAVIIVFLRNIRGITTDFKESIETQTNRMASVQERTTDSIDRNTEMFARVDTRLDQLTDLERKRMHQEAVRELGS